MGEPPPNAIRPSQPCSFQSARHSLSDPSVGFSVVPLAIGLILGGMLEQRLGQSMVMLDEKWWLMATRPICLVFFVFTAFALFGPMFVGYLKRNRPDSNEASA